MKNIVFKSLILAGALAGYTAGAAADPVADFYKGKALSIFVGSEAGGGYDIPARVLARHYARHIPGNPTIAVKNMPGANGVVLGNYMFVRAPKDGSEIAIVHNTIVIDAMVGNEAARFKPDQFIWIGSTSPLTNTCVVWHQAPAQSAEAARQTELRIGATSSTDASAIVPRFLNVFTGTKFRVVRGYPSTGAIYLALERGEIDGVCAAWDSIMKWRPAGQKSPDIRVILQINAKPDSTLKDVPFVMDFARNAQDREVLEFLTARQHFARPFLAPPGTPADRAAALRKAFMNTMKDADFLADAGKTQVPIDPLDGESVQAFIANLLKTPAHVIERAGNATRPEP